jgi:hypothetical protein
MFAKAREMLGGGKPTRLEILDTLRDLVISIRPNGTTAKILRSKSRTPITRTEWMTEVVREDDEIVSLGQVNRAKADTLIGLIEQLAKARK